MPLEEYEPGRAFPEAIGRTKDESSPAWPRPLRAAAGAPNVLFIVLDDTGFGQLGCYGSPIATPNFDALAAGGLLYTNMHTTALCSPSRSCIITGRNHHANAMASINELATGYPGYNGPDPVRERVLVGDAAGARLQHLHSRQVSPAALGVRVRSGAPTRARRSPPTTRRRSPSPASCIPSPSTSPATSSPTPRPRCAWQWPASSRRGGCGQVAWLAGVVPRGVAVNRPAGQPRSRRRDGRPGGRRTRSRPGRAR
jgi:Sulfatase